jgi:2-iminoacetate synthase
MSTESATGLPQFADWIRAADPHAAHRVKLVDRAERMLSGREAADPPARATLADRLERWRYQWLKERAGSLQAEDMQLSEALDLSANRLRALASREPRRPRNAVDDIWTNSPRLARASEALDPALPLAELTRLAARVTETHFTVQRHREVANGHQVDEAARPRRRVLLFAPLYVSNHCVNHCAYCGYRYPVAIAREQLSVDRAIEEVDVLIDRGFRHVLLVAGDFPARTGTDYFVELVGCLVERGVAPGLGIAPQSTQAYLELAAAGARAVNVYQETYDAERYAQYHGRGPKAAYDWRLEALDRAAEAGIGRLGLGILLGLAPPHEDLLAMVRHGDYLLTRFPDRRLTFSLPRIREAPVSFEVPFPVDDETFVRFYCALRLAFPDAELVLSTRETASMRQRLVRACVTQMSAGSCTAPGGYCSEQRPAENASQFPVCDRRSPAEVADWLAAAGFAVQWVLPGH